MHFTLCSYVIYSGHSELRTTSLQRTQLEIHKYFLPVVPIHFGPPKENHLIPKDNRGCPKVSIIQRFYCTQNVVIMSATWIVTYTCILCSYYRYNHSPVVGQYQPMKYSITIIYTTFTKKNKTDGKHTEFNTNA